MNALSALSDLMGPDQPTATGSDVLGKQEFLKILMTQLRNQDPLQPLDDREFISQMAQLSTLEATNNLAGDIKGLVGAQQQTQAMLLVGRQVQYADGNGGSQVGQVAGVRVDTNPPSLVVGGKEVPLTHVQTVL